MGFNGSITPGWARAVAAGHDKHLPPPTDDLALLDSCLDSSAGEAGDDLSREVYCILGMPIDVVDMLSVLRRLDCAAATSSPLLLSTPNLNYLVSCQSNVEFRDSLLLSDLSPADGMTIVWLGRLLGVPIKDRVSGSDIFAALKGSRSTDQPLKLFLFGGDEGVAAAASHALNAADGGAQCVGWYNPGFFSVEALSHDKIIDTINASAADFLVVCLGSLKGQLWLKRNSAKLRIPIRSHFGASLNFEAGAVKRAPRIIQKVGLEWLWRIKEERHLWKRYWHDGRVLLRLLYTKVLPIIIYRQMTLASSRAKLTVEVVRRDGCVTLIFTGAAVSKNVTKTISALRTALATRGCERIVVDLTNTCVIDSRFLGLLLVFDKMVKLHEVTLVFTGVSAGMERILRVNSVDFLLSTSDYASDNIEAAKLP